MNKGGHVWSLVYLEATYLEGPSFGKFHCPSALFADTNLYRQVNMIQPGRFYDGVATVCRRASFWSRTNSDGGFDGKRGGVSMRASYASLLSSYILTNASFDTG